MNIRRQTWQKIGTEWNLDHLERLTSVCALEELDREIDRILQGRQKGRVLVDLTS